MFGGPGLFHSQYRLSRAGRRRGEVHGIVVRHCRVSQHVSANVKPMLLAASNVHYRNNLILGKSETPEIFAVETNTNYSSSDYNGFRPNEGAEFSFEWSTPPLTMRANFPGEDGKLSTQQQAQLESKARETRRFKTLKEFSDATGQDKHSVLVDYNVFVKVSAAGPGSANPVQARGFRFPTSSGLCSCRCRFAPAGRERRFHGPRPDLGAVTKPVNHCRITVRGPRQAASSRRVAKTRLYQRRM